MVLGSTLSTSLGSLQIVIWSSRRPNSDRIIHVWYAPPLGFAPMLATHQPRSFRAKGAAE
jgi:hypothetical protein